MHSRASIRSYSIQDHQQRPSGGTCGPLTVQWDRHMGRRRPRVGPWATRAAAERRVVLRAALCSVFWGVTAAGFFAPVWLREVRAADRSNAMVSMEAFGA